MVDLGMGKNRSHWKSGPKRKQQPSPWDSLAPHEVQDSEAWDEIRDEDTFDEIRDEDVWEYIPDIYPTGSLESQNSILNGQVIHFPSSSNVNWLSYDAKTNPEYPILYVSYGKGKRGPSVYGYNDVSPAEVLEIAYADSVGRAIQMILKGVGQGRFGSLKPYFLVGAGSRPLWDMTNDSTTRHSAILMPGMAPEIHGGYHPLTNFAGAPGLMGAEDPNSPLWKPAPQFRSPFGKGGLGRR